MKRTTQAEGHGPTRVQAGIDFRQRDGQCSGVPNSIHPKGITPKAVTREAVEERIPDTAGIRRMVCLRSLPDNPALLDSNVECAGMEKRIRGDLRGEMQRMLSRIQFL